MSSSWSPTNEEIKAWASAEDADSPTQDWDLVLANMEHAGVVLSLASDMLCPNREFFEGVLRTMLDDCLRSEGQALSVADAQSLLSQALKSANTGVASWARATQLRLDELKKILAQKEDERDRTLAEALTTWVPSIRKGIRREHFMACLYRMLSPEYSSWWSHPQFGILLEEVAALGIREATDWVRIARDNFKIR